MDREERIVQEIINCGGERALISLGMSDDDRKIWELQALVLSHYRENGDLSKSAKLSGVPHNKVYEWALNDTLKYTEREAECNAQIGTGLAATLVQQLMDGKIKTAAVWKMALEKYLPRVFGADGEGEELPGKRTMDEVRKLNADFEARVDAEVQRRVAHAPAVIVENHEENENPLAYPGLDLRNRAN